MCLISGCHGSSTKASKLWGLRKGLCTFHYDAVSSHITKNGTVSYTGHEGLLDDFIKIKALMIDRETMMKCMKTLDTELRVAATEFRKGNLPAHDHRFGPRQLQDASYVQLSKGLEYYEGLCWFPSVHVLFINALTANDFLGYLTRLYMAKDPGAGANHGDFTHRLQWNAIMRVATNNFTVPFRPGWNHSPAELYKAMGEPLALGSAIGGVWGFVLDNGSGVLYNCPMPNGPNQNVATYGAPALFHADLLARTDIPMLRAGLARRFAKRDGAERLARAEIDKFYRDFAGVGLTGEIPKPEVAEIANKLYAWKKSAGPTARVVDATSVQRAVAALKLLPTAEKSAKKIASKPDYVFLLEAMAYRIWQAQRMQPGNVGHYVVGPTLIDQLLGPVLTVRGERAMTQSEVDARIGLSRRQFDTAYRFTKGKGVRKVFASS